MRPIATSTEKRPLSKIVPITPVFSSLHESLVPKVREMAADLPKKMNPKTTHFSSDSDENGIEHEFHDNFETGLSISYARANLQDPDLINIRMLDAEKGQGVSVWVDTARGIYQSILPIPENGKRTQNEIAAFRQRKQNYLNDPVIFVADYEHLAMLARHDPQKMEQSLDVPLAFAEVGTVTFGKAQPVRVLRSLQKQGLFAYVRDVVGAPEKKNYTVIQCSEDAGVTKAFDLNYNDVQDGPVQKMAPYPNVMLHQNIDHIQRRLQSPMLAALGAGGRKKKMQ